MDGPFEPIRSERVYEKVVGQVQSLLLSGRLQRGDRLPPEREMTELLGISRASLREAYSALELVGLIETRPREGTFIRAKAQSSIPPLALFFLVEENFDEDFLEVRCLLEIQTARLAAQKMSSDQRKQLVRCAALMPEASDDQSSIRYDQEFHRLLSQGGGNRMLTSLLTAISSVVDHHILSMRTSLFSSDSRRQVLWKVHERIAKAVLEGDSHLAEECMREHFSLIHAIRHEIVTAEADHFS